MPFTSTRQMAVCYNKEINAKARGKSSGWDCDAWLSETPDPACLPSLKGYQAKRACRNLKASEKVAGPIYQGPRGGYYFYVAGVKVYIPKNDAAIKYAKKRYGYAGQGK